MRISWRNFEWWYTRNYVVSILVQTCVTCRLDACIITEFRAMMIAEFDIWAWHMSVTCERDIWAWHMSVTYERDIWAWHMSVRLYLTLLSISICTHTHINMHTHTHQYVHTERVPPPLIRWHIWAWRHTSRFYLPELKPRICGDEHVYLMMAFEKVQHTVTHCNTLQHTATQRKCHTFKESTGAVLQTYGVAMISRLPKNIALKI